MISRRAFLKMSAAVGGVVLLRPGGGTVWAEPLPGGTLDPRDIDKYVRDLVIPPPMPRSGTRTIRGGKNADFYDIAVRQFRQEIVPGLRTRVWSYGSATVPGTFNYPAFTIEAKWRRPVAVRWRNELVDRDGNFRPHLLPVDPTLHWANPGGGRRGRDSRPEFDSTPRRYRGPVPIVTHLHGAEKVGDESDGYAEAWFLPDARDIPSGFAREGTWYDFFAQKWFDRYGSAGVPGWGPGSSTSVYLNDQRASTLWYHDHTLGMTRLNVYAGPAGFYLIRGGPDDLVVDRRSGSPATLPGPAPRPGDNPNKRYREIPIAIQDRAFDANGELFYPDTRAFFDGFEGPYIPDSDVSPIWNPEFFGNVTVVNGRSWPRLAAERCRYRLRLLNGCDSRFLILRFDDPRVRVWQIGTEGGFLPEPVDLDAVAGGRILLGLAERADLIVDFSDVPAGTEVRMLNLGPDEPFGGGEPGEHFERADRRTTGQVMRFDVGPRVAPDTSTPPAFLQLPSVTRLRGGSRRPVALLEAMSTVPGFDGPTEALLGTVTGGVLEAKAWHEPITEEPAVGSTEVWEIVNATADAHPIHIHEVQFQVVNRQRLQVHDDEVVQPIGTSGPARAPEPWERGFKDTVIAYPGEVTRVRMRFHTAGNYVWHCHIVSHEDNEMMRPYRIGPVQDGSPEQRSET